jgi:hypothetical protein
MKNKTLLTLGALAVVGVLGYNYYKKNKSGATGYSNASGKTRTTTTSKTAPYLGRCVRCRTADGGTYVPNRDSNCRFDKGERCLTNPV